MVIDDIKLEKIKTPATDPEMPENPEDPETPEEPEDPTDPENPNPDEIIISNDTITYPGEWQTIADQGYENNGVHMYTGTEGDIEIPLLNFSSLISQQSSKIMTMQSLDFTGHLTLYVSWTTGSDRADAIPYTLTHAGDTANDGVNETYDFTINQRLRADQITVGDKNQWSGWYEVGTFLLDEDSTLILTTVDNQDGLHNIIVDEFRLTQAETEPTPDPLCGNGEVEQGEMCDDGNLTNGDGCSAICVIESGNQTPIIPNGEGVIIYHHSDHLSGASVDTGAAGAILNLQDYFPFGGVRIEETVE